MARGLAIFIALFSLFNLLAQIRLSPADPKQPGYDPNHWWIDFRPLPVLLEQFVVLAFSLVLMAYALAPNMTPGRRRLTRTAIELVLVVVAWNVVNFYGGLFRGRYHTPFPVAFSLFVGAALWAVWVGVGSPRPARGPVAWGVMALTVAAVAVVFPLLQMFCFGLTDYSRPADTIVVFGARVYSDGQPSDALADRVRRGVELFKAQRARVEAQATEHPGSVIQMPVLFLSGGPGDHAGDLDEPHAMRNLAVSLGVPIEDTYLDVEGVNTDATARNVANYVRQLPAGDEPPAVLAVSHFYHLPRVKMAFAQEGMEAVAFTVPVRQPLVDTPKYMAREVVALWKYYFDALRR